MDQEKRWWEKPMRALQYNLQVRDTPKMDPIKLAEHLENVHANVVIVNAGGIYAWYDTEVPFHHKNEFLQPGQDLLGELIRCCHARGIRVIFRFDWSLAEDRTYLQHPEWFAQHVDKTPYYKGRDRMGEWSFLMTTCINSGYRNKDVAGPAMREAVGRYDADGIFFNNPTMPECHCLTCRKKYRKLYGEELPEDASLWRKDFRSRCLMDNIGYLQGEVKTVRDVPFVLYYSGMNSDGRPYADNLDERYATAEFVCTEAQDEVSKGVDHIPPIWKPMVNMKLGNAVPGYPKPFGIIHSCPGMDWRHTGLPKDEYLFWMAQVPANNAYLWHSVTGFTDTITDKRLLAAVEEIDARIEKCEDLMENAVSAAKILLLWDGSAHAGGFAEGLSNMQLQFDLMDVHHISLTRMKEYEAVILPDGFAVMEDLPEILEAFVHAGGNLIMERTTADGFEALTELSGCSDIYEESTSLSAAYLRLETQDPALRRDLEDTLYIPLKGRMLYLRPAEGTETLLSLVPPFAPPDAVGAPPERASLPAERTEIAGALMHRVGRGSVITLSFGLSALLPAYHLEDHNLLLRNLLLYSSPNNVFETEQPAAGILACVYTSGEHLLVHLINGIGKRPRIGHFPVHGLSFTVRLPEGMMPSSVRGVIEGSPVTYELIPEKADTPGCGQQLRVSLETLDVWEMVDIE
ncbi:MAG: hypothetical protein IJL78_04135 [Lachnospiraceae bacterium]|nr:hypothetical protein [Lachnospiraceae bacterium]